MKNNLKKKKTSHFTQVSNEFLNNPNLSFKAKGIFMYLWSKPDNWQVVVADIANHGNEGKSTIRKALNELREQGFLKWERYFERDATGKSFIAGMNYYLSETAEYKESFLSCGFEDVENEDVQTEDVQNVDEHIYKTNKEVTNKNKSNKLVSKLPTDSHFLKLKKEKQTDTLLEETQALKDEDSEKTLTSRFQEANLPTLKDPPDPPPKIKESSVSQSVNTKQLTNFFQKKVENEDLEKLSQLIKSKFKALSLKLPNLKAYMKEDFYTEYKEILTFLHENDAKEEELDLAINRSIEEHNKEKELYFKLFATKIKEQFFKAREDLRKKEHQKQEKLPPSKITLPKDLEEINQQFREEISLNFRIGIVEGQFTNKVLIIGFKDNKIPIVLFANENLKNCISLHYNLKLEKVLEKLCQRTLKGFEMKVANKECGRFEVGYE